MHLKTFYCTPIVRYFDIGLGLSFRVTYIYIQLICLEPLWFWTFAQPSGTKNIELSLSWSDQQFSDLKLHALNETMNY